MSRAAEELEVDGVVGKHVRPDPANDGVGQHGADHPVGVDDRHTFIDTGAVGERRFRQFDQLVVEGIFQIVVLFVARVAAEKILWLPRGREDQRQVEAAGFPMIHGGVDFQRVNPADHVVDVLETELRHDLTQLLGHHEQVVDYVLGLTGELLAQLRILGRDPDGTGVQMALAHHDATQRDQGRGGEAELLGAQQGGNRHVAPRLELPIGLQHHPRAQVVHHQGLVGFRHAQFPGHACMLDRRQRRRAGAAGVASDYQVVRAGLGDPGGDRPNAHLRAQLDADACLGIAVFQVMDQLGDVLDRVDVVMRRRADQSYPRR